MDRSRRHRASVFDRKALIGLYLGHTTHQFPFGAAGSVVLFLLWVYYSAQIFLFGAEFTEVYSVSRKELLPTLRTRLAIIEIYADCIHLPRCPHAHRTIWGSALRVRADDLAAHPLATLKRRFPNADWESIDEVYYGCVTQAGEDNRNVARMALLLADLPMSVPGVTVNRLCASGMEAVAVAARGIGTGEMSLAIAGGVESMSRSPWVMPKPSAAFPRDPQIFDTTLGWRFVNPLMEQKYGTISMAETAENVAEKYNVDRASQDRFALASQQKAAKAKAAGVFAEEIEPVCIPGKKVEVAHGGGVQQPRLEPVDQLPHRQSEQRQDHDAGQ